MIVLGLLLVAAGGVTIAAALLSTSGTATFLGADLGAATIFFLGLAAGLAVLWGYSLAKLGARRSWRLRRENRQLREVNARQARDQRTSTAGDDTAPL
jgi:membrane protein implicated in regulation of membrane protease activity